MKRLFFVRHVGRGSRRLLVRSAASIVAALAMGGSLYAATAVWIGPGTGGDFHNGANWNLSGASPTSADLAIIGAVNGTITYTGNGETSQTFFTEANVKTTLDLGPDETHSTQALLIVGSDSPNRDLEIPGGQVDIGSIFFIGSGVGAADADVTVSGANTIVRSGVVSPGSNGIFVGVGGDNATLTIKDGAKYIFAGTSNGLVAVGLQRTNNGVLTITDPGSSLTTLGSLQVGSNNDPGNPDMFNNQAKVLNGGSLTARVAQIGILTTSKQNTVTVSGPDSTMNLTGIGAEAPIGWRSVNNSLVVDNGGLIDGGNRFVMGIESTSTGNSTIVSSGGRINGTGFETRRGTLTVSGGSIYLKQYLNTKGTDDVSDDEYVGGSFVSNVGANGFVNFNSGTIEAVSADFNKAFTVGDGGGSSATYRMAKGQLGDIGTHSFTGGLNLSSNAVLEGSGNISANVSGSVGAQVNVGTSPGLINALNDWNNTGLGVHLEVGNFNSTPALPGIGFDHLSVAGAFTHGGSLSIDVSNYINGSGPLMDLKLVGWGSEVGSSASTAVSFIGGPAMTYEFRSDGFYLTNVAVIPEPASIALVATVVGLGFVQRRRLSITG